MADPAIQNAVGAYLVNELFTNVDVAGKLQSALPKQAAALAGPASAGLRDLATQAAPQLLARPRVQELWRQSNRAAHKQFLSILNGGNAALSTSNGQVVLDLHVLVTQLATTLGLSPPSAAQGAQARGVAQDKLGVTLPASSGRLVLMRSDQLGTAQDIAKGIRHLSIIFTVISLGLFALAIGLANGWRRIALRSTGWCFAGLGIAILLVRRVGGGAAQGHDGDQDREDDYESLRLAQVPFGPFLALGALIYLFAGREIIDFCASLLPVLPRLELRTVTLHGLLVEIENARIARALAAVFSARPNRRGRRRIVVKRGSGHRELALRKTSSPSADVHRRRLAEVRFEQVIDQRLLRRY